MGLWRWGLEMELALGYSLCYGDLFSVLKKCQPRLDTGNWFWLWRFPPDRGHIPPTPPHPPSEPCAVGIVVRLLLSVSWGEAAGRLAQGSFATRVTRCSSAEAPAKMAEPLWRCPRPASEVESDTKIFVQWFIEAKVSGEGRKRSRKGKECG